MTIFQSNRGGGGGGGVVTDNFIGQGHPQVFKIEACEGVNLLGTIRIAPHSIYYFAFKELVCSNLIKEIKYCLSHDVFDQCKIKYDLSYDVFDQTKMKYCPQGWRSGEYIS